MILHQAMEKSQWYDFPFPFQFSGDLETTV